MVSQQVHFHVSMTLLSISFVCDVFHSQCVRLLILHTVDISASRNAE